MIGLMGIENDGKTLVTTGGKTLFAVPRWAARTIQRVQHRIAMWTWLQ